MADTPQMDVPIANSEPSLPDNPNQRATAMMIVPAMVMSTRICTRLIPPSLAMSPNTNREPSATIPAFSQNS